jgi:O-antigen/teichoic acid export membrane protein
MKLGSTSGGFLQLTSANIITKIFGLISLGFFTRYLSNEQLAFLPVYGMLEALSYVLLGFGLQPTIIRRLPALLETDMAGAGWLIRTSTRILIIGPAMYCIGVFLLAEPLAAKLLGNPASASLIRLTAVGSFFFAWRNVCHYLLWSASRFDKIAIVRSVNAIGRAVLGVLGLMFGGILGLAIGLVLSDALTLMLILGYSRAMLQIPAGPGPSSLRLIRDSIPFYFESYLTYLRGQGDNWIVAYTLGPAAMGVYFVAMRFPMLLMMMVESLDKVITTGLSRRRKDITAIGSFVNELISHMVTISVPSIFLMIALMPFLTRFVAGPGFEGAVLPAMILCAMQLVRILAVPTHRGVFVVRPPMARVMITVVESIFLVGSLFLLIPVFAVTGVAVGRFIAALAMLVGSFVALKGHLVVRFPWHRLAVSTVISTAMAAVILVGTSSLNNVLLAALITLAGVVVFFILTWLFQAEAFITALEKMLPIDLAGPLRRLMRQSR